MPNTLIYGRVLMADSLGFHIIFALLGVGLPLIVSLAELIGWQWKDKDFTFFAKRWSYAMSVLFVTGAISGTIVAFELALLWPPFMTLVGQVVSLPIYLEVFAFFLEAIFLGIYLFTWDRFSPMVHWLTSLPIVLGSFASAYLITTVNAFMNSPAGFALSDGKPININPFVAMFNQAVPTETSHSIVSYYLTSALIVAALYAFTFLRRKNKNDAQSKKALVFCLSFAFVFSLLVGLTGDQSGQYIAHNEPIKLAAAEGLQHSQAYAPLVIFGLKMPGMLSVLAYHDPSAKVEGFDNIDPRLRPPSFVHTMFDSMAVAGIIVVLVPLVFLLLYWRKRSWAFSKPMFWSIIVSALCALFAVEAGWMVTEVGRQPYIIAGVMLTERAFTTSTGVVEFAVIFPVLYLLLAIVTVWILVRHYKTTV